MQAGSVIDAAAPGPEILLLDVLDGQLAGLAIGNNPGDVATHVF